MKIIEDFPPNYTLIQTVFSNCEKYKALFCYGDTIYNPFKVKVTPDLEVHEQTHSKRQGNNPDEWWMKYLSNPQFRLEEEIIAYGTQYALARKVAHRKMSDWVKEKCAQSLSGELYGNIISYGEAESKIRNYAKTVTI